MGAPHGNVSDVSATRFPSHQLRNGLYVSGRPDQHKERGSTIAVPQMPYTGGDVKKSGELGKMFDIPVDSLQSTRFKTPVSFTSPAKHTSRGASSSHSGPLLSNEPTPSLTACVPSGLAGPAKQLLGPDGQVSKSGPLAGAADVSTRLYYNSGPLTGFASIDSLGSANSKNVQSKSLSKGGGSLSCVFKSTSTGSGPISPTLPATGLITSGPISTTGATRNSQSGPLDGIAASGKPSSGVGGVSLGINHLSHEHKYSLGKAFPKVVLCTVIPLFLVGFIAGGFIIAAVQNSVLLLVVAALFTVVVLVLAWNVWWGSRSVTRYLAKLPYSELGAAKDGQYVKVTGVVTCGSVPLESSYQKATRCMYTSTGLYEYGSLFSKPRRLNHNPFRTWGLRHLERLIVDFYISDSKSGQRALVKAGSDSRVTPYVVETTVLDITPDLKELPSDFLRWLSERKLSRDDRTMRLKEGYIKEGSTVTVLGVVQRQENVLMIVPSPEGSSTGCQWKKLLLPANLDGIILTCDEITRNEGIPL